jgi:hypothetical protein
MRLKLSARGGLSSWQTQTHTTNAGCTVGAMWEIHDIGMHR